MMNKPIKYILTFIVAVAIAVGGYFLFKKIELQIQEDKYRKDVLSVEEKVLEELKTGVLIDTVFLGYRVGMNREEFSAHTSMLLKQNKLKMDDYEYIYSVQTDEYTKVKGELIFDFFKDSLYMVGFKIKPDIYSTSIKLPIMKFFDLLNEKYNKIGHSFFFIDKEWNLLQAHYVENNLHISLHEYFLHGEVKYIDTRRELLKEDYDKRINRNRYKLDVTDL